MKATSDRFCTSFDWLRSHLWSATAYTSMLHPVMASELPVLQRDGNFCSAVKSIIGKDSTRVREASERKVDLKAPMADWAMELDCGWDC